MSQNNPPATYMFVFRYPENEPDPTPEEMQKSFEKWRVWIGQMRASGQYIAGDPLEDNPAKVLRGPRGAKLSDGPFAEAKEVVAGYVMIKAPSFEAAVEMAKGCPAFDLPGRSVEVRQLKPMSI
jgi:hypothetical protein